MPLAEASLVEESNALSVLTLTTAADEAFQLILIS